MTDPRIPEHLGRFLGQGTQAETLQRGVQLWRYERPEFVSFATHGLSTLDVAALKPQELVCSVEHGQDGAAAHLVTTMLDMIIKADHGPVAPQLIPAQQPILAGTQITGLLATSHPYLDEPFNAIRDDHGTIQTQIITLIPLTGIEVARAQSSGLDALEASLEQADPPLLDVTRAPT
ncbi:suppressor of fused domain protein [Saccharopolyspora spinosa]|uniref:Suppressor of fused protein SUFU n=1 Tax=Saccharopolyspora spinosa TaxID=60894 RepID=A0A2N3Y719_SACSN|nr:suppressor of fused domain protein [Saccharopolyspora spinosa]PKW18700.1 suppressor of fused protein SUFU [Saccharopolyspora spinosa]